MNLKDFILKTTPKEAYEAVKQEKFYSLLLKTCKYNFPNLYDLVDNAYELRFQGITSGILLRYSKTDKVEFLEKNIKKSLKIIDAECFRIGLIPILFKPIEEVFNNLDTQITLINSFSSSFKESLKEFEIIFIKSFDKIVTPQFRIAAGLKEDNSEDFRFISELIQNDFNIGEAISDDAEKSKFTLFSSNMTKLFTLVIFELSYYQKVTNLRKSFDEDASIPNDSSTLNVAERRSIVSDELAFMSGNDKSGARIMSDNDYKRMIDFTIHFVTKTELPEIDKKIPITKVTMEKIRFTYYNIYQRIYGGKGHKDRFVDFLHAAFEQFTGEKSTTKTKFSVAPNDKS